MSDEHHGAALFLLQANDEIKNRVGVFTVEIAGRFVGQQERWSVGQTARDRNPLALAAGELGREMIKPILETDEPQQFASAFASLGMRAMDFEHRELHVLGRGKSRQEMKSLENKSEFVKRGTLRDRDDPAAILRGREACRKSADPRRRAIAATSICRIRSVP